MKKWSLLAFLICPMAFGSPLPLFKNYQFDAYLICDNDVCQKSFVYTNGTLEQFEKESEVGDSSTKQLVIKTGSATINVRLNITHTFYTLFPVDSDPTTYPSFEYTMQASCSSEVQGCHAATKTTTVGPLSVPMMELSQELHIQGLGKVILLTQLSPLAGIQ